MVKGEEAIKLWSSVFKLDSVSVLVITITKHVFRSFCYSIIIGSINTCFLEMFEKSKSLRLIFLLPVCMMITMHAFSWNAETVYRLVALFCDFHLKRSYFFYENLCAPCTSSFLLTALSPRLRWKIKVQSKEIRCQGLVYKAQQVATVPGRFRMPYVCSVIWISILGHVLSNFKIRWNQTLFIGYVLCLTIQILSPF